MWVKLHRCLLKKPIWQNPNLFRVFCWCLMKASWNHHEQIVGMTKVQLEPGQFVYGRLKASEETGLHESTIRNCMNWLKQNNTLTINSTNKYSVVTVVNWALYQSELDTKDSQQDSQQDNNRTTTGQQQDTTKKIKKVKKLKEETYDYFSDFWREYPKKDKKIPAQKIFARLKMNDELMSKIMDSLYRFIESEQWTKENGKYVPLPTTWLNERRWEDGN